VGMGSMATPFFILYGTEGLGLGTGIVGLCLTMQVIGRAVGGIWLGVGIEKIGSRLTVLGGIVLNLLAPLMALALSFLGRLVDPRALPYVYSIAFLGLGTAMNAVPMGLSNYILDIAPPKDRSTYIGLTNTISGLLIVAPILGGALLEYTSYGVLFAVTLAIYALAVLAGWRMPTVQERAST
jgi:MFS family permease